MKIMLFLLFLSLSSVATGDTVNKWTDEKGRIHYGNKEVAGDTKKVETIEIEDSFDQESYEAGLQRHEETELWSKEYEVENKDPGNAGPGETAGEIAPGSPLTPSSKYAPGAELAPDAKPAPASKPGPGSKSAASFKTAPGSRPVAPKLKPKSPVVKPKPGFMPN